MDILDTGGDWLQLFAAIAGFFMVNGFFSGFFKNIIWTVIAAIILWSTVYDYDLVIGYLIGGGLSAGFAANEMNKRRMHPVEAGMWTTQAFTGVAAMIIMITKMVVFW